VGFQRRSRRISSQLERFRALPRGERAEYARETIDGYLSRFLRRFQRDRDDTAALVDVNDRFLRLINAYAPGPLDVPTLLLTPIDGKLDYAPGWRPLLGRALETRDVPGGHASVFELPNVAVLGRELERRMSVVGGPAMIEVAAE
jgi:hypothetical protein